MIQGNTYIASKLVSKIVMSKLNWSKYKKWSVYLLAIPVILLFIIGFKYLINASETLNGNYSYEFMFGADSIPTPWYMKTAELFFKYCLWYGMSITVLTIGYLIAVLKEQKFNSNNNRINKFSLLML